MGKGYNDSDKVWVKINSNQMKCFRLGIQLIYGKCRKCTIQWCSV